MNSTESFTSVSHYVNDSTALQETSHSATSRPVVPVNVSESKSESESVKIVYSLTQLKQMYLDTLSPKETKAYNIAYSHLGSSFTLEKSIGYLQWKKETSL